MVSTRAVQVGNTNADGAPGWRLKLLGGVELCGPRGRIPLEGRIAAALAYVAWTAPTPKAQLAGLLWPDTEPSQERNNLRQLLRRLRLASGECVLQSVAQQDALVLDDALDCDLLRLRDAAHRGHSEDVLQLQGGLLAGLDFDELPEFTRWLDGARLAAEGWFRKLIGLELRRREDAGDLLGAICVAETWLGLEPESEPIARTLMRLHHVAGSRHAALHVYEQLKARLAHELGVSPMDETAALARRIARSLQQERSAAAGPPPTPLRLRRPWLRVGRDAEWAQLEAGWAQGRVLCVAGAPGVGKSRLALDFAASRGDFLLVAGHPADPGTPYATVARALRQALASAAHAAALPAWVRAELSQLLPEFAPPRRTRRRSARGLLVRLHAALAQALTALSPRAASVVLDNLQWWDAESLAFLATWIASLEAPAVASGALLAEPLAPEEAGLHALCCVESTLEPAAEPARGLPGSTWDFLAQAHRVELGPLPRQALLALVDSLELPHAGTQLGPEVWRFTGGNPFLALETLRDWVRRTTTAAEAEGAPVGSEQVAAVARGRVTRLHPAALEVARVAALAEDSFDLALAAEALELPELEVARILQRLQRMGLAWLEPEGAMGVSAALAEPPPATLTRLLHARFLEALGRRRSLAAAAVVERAARAGWTDAEHTELHVQLP